MKKTVELDLGRLASVPGGLSRQLEINDQIDEIVRKTGSARNLKIDEEELDLSEALDATAHLRELQRREMTAKEQVEAAEGLGALFVVILIGGLVFAVISFLMENIVMIAAAIGTVVLVFVLRGLLEFRARRSFETWLSTVDGSAPNLAKRLKSAPAPIREAATRLSNGARQGGDVDQLLAELELLAIQEWSRRALSSEGIGAVQAAALPSGDTDVRGAAEASERAVEAGAPPWLKEIVAIMLDARRRAAPPDIVAAALDAFRSDLAKGVARDPAYRALRERLRRIGEAGGFTGSVEALLDMALAGLDEGQRDVPHHIIGWARRVETPRWSLAMYRRVLRARDKRLRA